MPQNALEWENKAKKEKEEERRVGRVAPGGTPQRECLWHPDIHWGSGAEGRAGG